MVNEIRLGGDVSSVRSSLYAKYMISLLRPYVRISFVSLLLSDIWSHQQVFIGRVAGIRSYQPDILLP